MQDWKMTDKILANSGQNYGVWKMQDFAGSGKCRSTSLVEFNLPIQCTSKKLYVVHFNYYFSDHC